MRTHLPTKIVSFLATLISADEIKVQIVNYKQSPLTEITFKSIFFDK